MAKNSGFVVTRRVLNEDVLLEASSFITKDCQEIVRPRHLHVTIAFSRTGLMSPFEKDSNVLLLNKVQFCTKVFTPPFISTKL